MLRHTHLYKINGAETVDKNRYGDRRISVYAMNLIHKDIQAENHTGEKKSLKKRQDACVA